MGNKLAVKLIGPAKVDGKRQPVGKVVYVSPLVASQLADAGAIKSVTAIDEAVASLNARNENLVDEVGSEVTAELVAERDQAIRRLEAAETRIAYLENQLAEIKTNTEAPEGENAATDDGSAPQAGVDQAPATEKPSSSKPATKKPTPKTAAAKKPVAKKNATGGKRAAARKG